MVVCPLIVLIMITSYHNADLGTNGIEFKEDIIFFFESTQYVHYGEKP